MRARRWHRLTLTLGAILCFLSCETVPGGTSRVERPFKPAEPSIRWVHLRPEFVAKVNQALAHELVPPLEPGELLTYPEFRKLAEWLIVQRGYVKDLEDTLTYYETLN